MNDLVPVEKNKAYQILNKAAEYRTEVQIKIANEQKILNTYLKKIGVRKHFYITAKPGTLENKPEATIKIIVQNKLFFLKTNIKKVDENYYFEDYEIFFELIRRKTPRFQIPQHWTQSAVIQSAEPVNALKSVVTVVEMSKTGMKLNIVPELPRYEKNQIIKLKFKIFRRAEIITSAKIVHLKKNISSGPTIGIQFESDSILIKNKIQNLCDDLAFFYVAERDA